MSEIFVRNVCALSNVKSARCQRPFDMLRLCKIMVGLVGLMNCQGVVDINMISQNKAILWQSQVQEKNKLLSLGHIDSTVLWGFPLALESVMQYFQSFIQPAPVFRDHNNVITEDMISKYINSLSASRDNWSTVGGDGECRVGEVWAGTTSPMPDHKGFKLQ